MTGSPAAAFHHDLIITLAARHRLPAVYNGRFWAAGGGLISYGPDFLDQLRRAASYVDRILKSEKSGHLPVQAPTKFELIVNLKTAKVLGLPIPSSVLACAVRTLNNLRCPLLAQTSLVAPHISAFGGKADIAWTCWNVR